MNEIGRMLADAVPPLPEPVDRIGEVRARVRRARTRAAVAACAAVVVLAGLALALSARLVDDPAPVATGLDADDCPAFVDLPTGDEDRPGPLVPDGATEVMLCESNRSERLVGHQVLRTGADRVTDVLNALPTRARVLAGEAVGESDWSGCNEARYYEQASLVLRYPDGTTVTVLYDRNCDRSIVPGGAARYGNALCEFAQLYRSHVNATAAMPDPWPPCE